MDKALLLKIQYLEENDKSLNDMVKVLADIIQGLIKRIDVLEPTNKREGYFTVKPGTFTKEDINTEVAFEDGKVVFPGANATIG